MMGIFLQITNNCQSNYAYPKECNLLMIIQIIWTQKNSNTHRFPYYPVYLKDLLFQSIKYHIIPYSSIQSKQFQSHPSPSQHNYSCQIPSKPFFLHLPSILQPFPTSRSHSSLSSSLSHTQIRFRKKESGSSLSCVSNERTMDEQLSANQIPQIPSVI